MMKEKDLIQLKVKQDEFVLEFELVESAFVGGGAGGGGHLLVHLPNHVVVEVENYPIEHEEEEKDVAHPKHLASEQHKTQAAVVDVGFAALQDDGAVVDVDVVVVVVE
jgi:hypothetical protein